MGGWVGDGGGVYTFSYVGLVTPCRVALQKLNVHRDLSARNTLATHTLSRFICQASCLTLVGFCGF